MGWNADASIIRSVMHLEVTDAALSRDASVTEKLRRISCNRLIRASAMAYSTASQLIALVTQCSRYTR